jgi:hypothetical protein
MTQTIESVTLRLLRALLCTVSVLCAAACGGAGDDGETPSKGVSPVNCQSPRTPCI